MVRRGSTVRVRQRAFPENGLLRSFAPDQRSSKMVAWTAFGASVVRTPPDYSPRSGIVGDILTTRIRVPGIDSTCFSHVAIRASSDSLIQAAAESRTRTARS